MASKAPLKLVEIIVSTDMAPEARYSHPQSCEGCKILRGRLTHEEYPKKKVSFNVMSALDAYHHSIR